LHARGDEILVPAEENDVDAGGSGKKRVAVGLAQGGAGEDGMAASGDLVVVPLPTEPVSSGAEWTVPQEVVVEVPGGPRKAVRTRLRYRLVDVADGRATIRVDTTVLTPIDDPRLEARLLERIWDGEIRFDVEAGRVESRRTGIDRRVVGFGGPQSSVRYKASLEERLVD
jgi:hypothetical protein